MIRFAVRLGAERGHLLRRAGLDAARLDDLDGWLEGSTMVALCEAAVAETGDPDFGLRMGIQVQPGVISIVGYSMMSASTLGDALGVLMRYGPLIAIIQAVCLERGALGRPASVEMVPHQSGPLADYLRQPLEAAMAAFMTLSRAVTGRPLPTIGAEFSHPQPDTGTEVHASVFDAPLTFDADACRVSFDSEALRWPCQSASPALYTVFRREADRALRAVTGSVRARAMAALETSYRGEIPTLGEIASDLAMSERTLQRHLEDENTTFQALCDDVRRDLALRHLRTDDRSIQEVASLLGYSAPSAFHRAFKRWTGQTPGAFKEAARRREPAENAE